VPDVASLWGGTAWALTLVAGTWAKTSGRRGQVSSMIRW